MDEMQTTNLTSRHIGDTLEQPLHTIFLAQHPNTFDEIACDLRALGNAIEVLSFEHSGERTFGHLERVRFNGVDCIVKHVGPQSSELFDVCVTGVQQERDGLVLARGMATPLIAEVRVDNVVVAVFRQFSEGEPLRDAVRAEKLSPADARFQAQELVEKLTESGLYLWDCNTDNIWRRPDGAVVLLEGQCVIPSEDNAAELREKNMKHLDAMFPPY